MGGVNTKVRCPRCGGDLLAEMGSGWVECRSDVPYSGAPPELTGLPHPVIDFGPCQHRFQPSAVLAAASERQNRERLEAEVRAASEAAELERAAESRRTIEASSDATEILQVLDVREGLIAADVLRQAWLRLLACGAIVAGKEEIITLEGRGTVIGYFLSRGTMTTQWGKWTELKREPAFRARQAGHEVRPGHGETSELVKEGFDVWFDPSGELWSDGWSGGSARLSIGGSSRSTHRLIVAPGASPKLQRRKAKWMGWEIRVPNAQSAWPYEASDIEYARALKAVLSQY
jgi:hypothetical protein